MSDYLEVASKIPWASFGVETVSTHVGLSVVPVGTYDHELPKFDENSTTHVADRNKNEFFEKNLINIIGTAILGGEGKFVTCKHVMDAINEDNKKAYVLIRQYKDNSVIYSTYPIINAFKYVDPRNNKVNDLVDLAVLIVPAIKSYLAEFNIPIVRWGDSTKIGVGDRVYACGYPYGTELFLFNQSNRGIIQPTFYSGIISSIIPAQNTLETRVFQLDMAVAGGISGGAVFNPENGNILGMIMSGLTGEHGDPHPITHFIPSEVIMPYVGCISFDVKDGKRWGKNDPLWFDEYEKK